MVVKRKKLLSFTTITSYFSREHYPNSSKGYVYDLRKNGQKIYIIPSKKMAAIRMGDAADNLNLALSDFDTTFWKKNNALYNN